MTTMTANNTDLAEDAVPANGAAPASRVEELQFLVQTGRLRHWQRGVTETLARAGLGGGLTAEEWAATPWYGPLETWLKDGSTVSDILINGPGRDITIVEQGQRMASGITLHPEWVSFVQRQLILRSGLVTPEQVVDVQAMMWPAHALIGTADQRLRFAITRPPASPAGPTVSLRILPRRWRMLDDFVLEGIMPRQAVDMLIEALRRGVSILIAGGTGSGKTTLTAALLQAIGEEKRVVTIEEARELPAAEWPDLLGLCALRAPPEARSDRRRRGTWPRGAGNAPIRRDRPPRHRHHPRARCPGRTQEPGTHGLREWYSGQHRARHADQ